MENHEDGFQPASDFVRRHLPRDLLKRLDPTGEEPASSIELAASITRCLAVVDRCVPQFVGYDFYKRYARVREKLLQVHAH